MIEYENLKKANQSFFEEYQVSFNEVLNSGWYILGKHVETFEKQFANYCGNKHCVGVASGLDALYLSLKALNLEEGSEVIVPSNTYIATILSVLQNNLKPVLVEPKIDTYNIDPTKIEECITSKTKVILVVHLYGKVCEMDAINFLAKKYNLAIIEDCAQSHGAKFKEKKCGTFGVFGAFSFYPTKNLGCMGDGGAITTDNDEYYQLLKSLRNYGSRVKYVNDIVGINSRLDEMQAAFLSVKLQRLDAINNHKRKLASLYHQHIKSDFIKPVVQTDYYDVFHIYNIRHSRRDALKEYLLASGIKTEIHYPIAPHKQKALEGFVKGDFPISEEIHNTTLSLPISYFHSEDDIYKVIDVLNKF